MTTPLLPFSLDREVTIRARRETVFSYFTDSARWASWWGAGSTIDPRPGGTVFVRHPGGIEAAGEVVELVAPERIVFTYGFASGQPMPPGTSRVTIVLAEETGGTRLRLRHDFAEAGPRDHHVQGWRYQLSLFANVVADEVQREAAQRIDGWFAAWCEPDAAVRHALLDGCVASQVRFRDRYSLIDGRADLEPHLAAVQIFMPGSRQARHGAVRHCQGTALANWIAHRADGAELGRGTNVFGFDVDGRLVDVVGIWS